MCIFKDYTGRRAKERWKVKDCKLRNQLGGHCSNWGGLPWPTLCSWQWQKGELTGFKDDLERQLTGPSDWLDRTEDRLLRNVKRKEVSKAALELLPWAAVEKAEPITESEHSRKSRFMKDQKFNFEQCSRWYLLKMAIIIAPISHALFTVSLWQSSSEKSRVCVHFPWSWTGLWLCRKWRYDFQG